MYIIGRITGLVLFWTLVKPMRYYWGRKTPCSYYNNSTLSNLRGKSFLVVSNHIKPRSRFLKFVSMPYDAYVLRKMFQDSGVYTTAVTSYDAPTLSSSGPGKWIQTRLKFPMTRGIVESMDLIPLNRKKQDKKTAEEFRRRIQKKPGGIGMFPEGTWFRGFRANRKFFPGFAIFARRFKLPILPVYLNAYNSNGDFDARVGTLIEDVSDARATTELIRAQFIALKENGFYVPGDNDTVTPAEPVKDPEKEVSLA